MNLFRSPQVGSVEWFLILSTVCSFQTMAEDATLVVFEESHSRVYLDISNEETHRLGIENAVEDLSDCFERMTGRPLARSGGTVRLFDPAQAIGTRFKCTVRNMRDASKHSSVNAQAALVLSPTQRFDGGPFAGPGEKVAWNCTWHRSSHRLAFRLVVANQPYHGPGYGPFTFVKLQTKAPRFDGGITRVLVAF